MHKLNEEEAYKQPGDESKNKSDAPALSTLELQISKSHTGHGDLHAHKPHRHQYAQDPGYDVEHSWTGHSGVNPLGKLKVLDLAPGFS